MLPAWPSAACMSARRRSSRPCVFISFRARCSAPRFICSRFVVIAPPLVEARVHTRVPPDHWVKRAALGTGGAGRWLREWRFAAVAGATVGLALAPLVSPHPSVGAAGVAPIAVIGMSLLRPRDGVWAALAWLAVIGLVAALAGLLVGGARLHSIDAGALRARPGQPVKVDGYVAGVPR